MKRETQPVVCPACGCRELKKTVVANDSRSGYVEHKVECAGCDYVWGEYFENGMFQGLIARHIPKPRPEERLSQVRKKISTCPVCGRVCDRSGCRFEELPMILGTTIWRLTFMVHQECIRKQKGRDLVEKTAAIRPHLEK